MIPYLLFFLIAGIPALFYARNPNKVLWAIAWLLFVLFIGLRHEVGGDWDGYLIITNRISHLELGEALSEQEFLFALITWVSTQLNWGVYGANVVGAIIFCTGLFAFCATLPNRWLALAAAIPFLVVVAVMSANRQGMAIGIILFVMSRWQNFSLLKRSLGILLAGFFHTSALLLLVLTVADLRIGRLKKAVLMVIAVAAGIWLVSLSEAAWYRYTTIYVNQSAGAYSSGAIFHLMLNLIPAVFMLMNRRRWAQLSDHWQLLSQLCWMAVALLGFAPFFTVPVGRMSLYLFPVSITFLAYSPTFIRIGAGRALIRTITVMGLGGVLAIWLTFANTAFTYLPYQNVVFLESWQLAMPR